MGKDEILAEMAELGKPKYYFCDTETPMNALRERLFNLEHPEHAYPERF
jgi:hypothetical protein